VAEPVLEARGLSKAFGALVACEPVDLELRPGEIHALIGPNGAGKSTLIAMLAGGVSPDAGSVHLAGREVTSLPTAARARLGLARTFQIAALALESTVLENAVLGAAGAQGRAFRMLGRALGDGALAGAARTALARTGLTEASDRRVADLSHGQRRQLEIAVALTLEPKLFVMDEPLAGLGLEGAQAMVALLGKLRAEAPILLVEHDMDAVFALADRISVLVGGRLIATGPPAAIRADPQVRRAYLGEAP